MARANQPVGKQRTPVAQGLRGSWSRSRSLEGSDAQRVARRPCALIVDDDALLLRAMNRRLHYGFDVRLATSVAEGLAEVERLGRVDLAFVDFELPDGTGEVVLRALERWPDAIRVLMSGNTRKIEELRRCGSLVPLVLQKPLCSASVTAAVRAALNH